MSMQIRRMIPGRVLLSLLAVLVFGLGPFSYGQFASKARPAQRTLGYYDPATGKFEPLASAQDSDAPPVVATTGTLVFKFTITVKSVIPKNSVIGCSADADVSDSSGFSADEHGTGVAKLVSGDTYSCSVTIPYSWLLSSPTTDTIFLDTTADIAYGYEVTATNGSATTIEPVDDRVSTHSVPSIKVPATGATTTETITYTL
jgi:hypothetical protein